MRINFLGEIVNEAELRAGLIGCGSHAFRNILPTFQFTPFNLIATCDIDMQKATVFAQKFGAHAAYKDFQAMLMQENLDAVFVITPFDDRGRPMYPEIAVDVLDAGVNVWIEKPPAATTAEVERMEAAAEAAGKLAMVGLKRMFFQATEKAKALTLEEDFGEVSLISLERNERMPTVEEMHRFLNEELSIPAVTHFLDHLVHPASALLYLVGMPDRMFYQRSVPGSGLITFSYDEGPIAGLAINYRDTAAAGSERIKIVGTGGHTIIVDNNVRVTYARPPEFPEGQRYGNTPSYFMGSASTTSAYWEPEFSIGQLYSKGLFLQGYWGEIDAFARAITGEQPLTRGTLEHAWQVTRIFEAVAEGPGKMIEL